MRRWATSTLGSTWGRTLRRSSVEKTPFPRGCPLPQGVSPPFPRGSFSSPRGSCLPQGVSPPPGGIIYVIIKKPFPRGCPLLVSRVTGPLSGGLVVFCRISCVLVLCPVSSGTRIAFASGCGSARMQRTEHAVKMPSRWPTVLIHCHRMRRCWEALDHFRMQQWVRNMIGNILHKIFAPPVRSPLLRDRSWSCSRSLRPWR